MLPRLSRNGPLKAYSWDLGLDRNIVRNSGNAKFVNGMRDLTAIREAGFAKIGTWKENGIRDRYYRSSGSAIVVKRRVNTGSGRPHSRPCSVIAFP